MRTVVAITVALVACGERSPDHHVPEGNARVGGDVISTVEGHPIEIDTVTSLARSAELDPAEALQRRQAEELLALEAFRRGYGERDQPEQRARQQLVRALLDRIAEEVPLESISEEDVRTRFAQRRPELTPPEQRAIRHIVVRVEGADGERWSAAEDLARRLRGEWVTDPGAYARYRQAESLESFPLHVEASGSIVRGGLENRLDEAVFRASEPGILPDVYRSSGGWHVIELVRIDVPEPPSFDAFADQMRDEIATQRRHAALVARLDEVRERVEVEIDEVVAARALALELER